MTIRVEDVETIPLEHFNGAPLSFSCPASPTLSILPSSPSFPFPSLVLMIWHTLYPGKLSFMSPYTWGEHCANSGIKKKLESRHHSQKSCLLVERRYMWPIIQLEYDSCNNRILSNRILCRLDNGLVDLTGEGKGLCSLNASQSGRFWVGESALPRLVKDRKVAPVERAEYEKPLKKWKKIKVYIGTWTSPR